jgi:hypothetical protein
VALGWLYVEEVQDQDQGQDQDQDQAPLCAFASLLLCGSAWTDSRALKAWVLHRFPATFSCSCLFLFHGNVLSNGFMVILGES